MKYPPYAHQTTLIKLMRKGSHLVGCECGTGKTFAGLAIAELAAAKSLRTLVIAPLPLLQAAWIEDAEKFCPGLRIKSLWGYSAAKRKKNCAEAANADICLINYESFKMIEPWIREQKFTVLILDESSRIKNQNKTSREVMKFARTVPYVFPMNGTIKASGMLGLYNQAQVVRPGLLGDDFWQYRGRWFIARGRNKQGHKFDYQPRKGAVEEIMNLIKPYATILEKKDCLDLPEKVFMTLKYNMSSKLRTAYDTMVKDKILPLIEGREAIGVSCLAEIMKLRQLTSGWLFDSGQQVFTFDDGKAQLLDEVLAEIGEQPVIIWVQFRHDAQQLCNRLEGAIPIIGGLGPKKVQEHIQAFKNGDARYAVAHPASVAHGVTWTNCSYCVYYSLSYSLEHWLQSQDRIHRIGTTKKCTYISLLADNSIDETIYEALIKKEGMSNAALSYLKTQT